MISKTQKYLAIAALAMAGTIGLATTDAEARGGRGGHGGGFHGGGHGGFRGGFGGGFHRHGHGFHRHHHHHRHGHWHHRHYRFGALYVGGAIASCEWVRRFDPAYGVYRRVQICD
jgi:hypothetical protein